MAHLVRAVALLALAASTLGACSSTPPRPRPEFVVQVTGMGGPAKWNVQVDGAYTDQGTVQSVSAGDRITIPADPGQRVTFSVAVEASGWAECRVLRGNGDEAVPLQEQALQAPPARPVTPPAECTFVA